MWMHPILQFVALFIAAYVLQMGYCRFRMVHLKQKVFFNWKRHVFLGKIVNVIWLAGLAFGLFAAHNSWGTVGLSGSHYTVGIAMLPLILFSLATGYILQKPRGKRTKLALAHGAANVILFLMALFQAWSGLGVIQLFLLD